MESARLTAYMSIYVGMVEGSASLDREAIEVWYFW